MAEKRDTSAEHFTFSQRHGHEPLPEPMRLEELSDHLRREIWNATFRFLTMDRSGNDPSMGMLGAVQDYKTPIIIRNVLGEFLKLPHDEIDANVRFHERHANYRETKERILRGAFNRVLDFIGIVANLPSEVKGTRRFIDTIQHQFEKHAAAYWLDTSRRPFWFFPRSSREQGEATQRAIETIRESGMEVSEKYLRKAAVRIKAQQYADSVKSSIDAVESVARRIAPKSKTLGLALKALEKKGILTNQQLKEGFEKLYAYTNSEEGARHPLVFKNSSDIGLDEAMFMFGACASFAAYLVNKHRQMNQQQDGDQ